MKYGGGFENAVSDYGGYFTWDQARGLTSTYRTTLWFSGTLPGGSTTKTGGKTVAGATGSGTGYNGSTIAFTGTDGSVCPTGWRLPTVQEFANLIGYTGTISVSSEHNGTAGANNGRNLTLNGVAGFAYDGTGGTLFFPLAGCYGGSYGYYWSSTECSADNAYRLLFASNRTYGILYGFNKTDAYSVRCVR